MYIIKKLLGIAVVLLLVSCNGTMSKLDVANSVTQIQLERIEAMPNFPKPFKILDFKEVAIRFDSLVYDETQTGKYWPLIWKDNSRKNFDQETFGIYTAVGDVRQGIENHNGIFHESLATIGSVLGASLIGIDKSNQKGENYVSMLKNYFNTETGWNIIMNNTCPDVALLGGGYARDWWYDVFPNVLFYALADLYPEEKEYSTIQRTIAEQFYKADSILDGNYSYPFFDYFAMKPKKSSIYHQSETLAYPPSDCFQEDVAAGHAYVLYAAYQKFNDPKYLKGAKSSIEALLGVKKNSFYEVLMPYGAYVAARLNAEEGTDYNYTKILEWTFNGTSLCRKGWGVIVDNWNGYDVSGLIGNTENEGDRVFLMNTYDAMWPLVPMVRYDQKYANIIGKWMLNAANAIKFFYPYEISNDHQLAPELKQHTKGVIAYEGLIKNSTRNYQKKKRLLHLERDLNG